MSAKRKTPARRGRTLRTRSARARKTAQTAVDKANARKRTRDRNRTGQHPLEKAKAELAAEAAAPPKADFEIVDLPAATDTGGTNGTGPTNLEKAPDAGAIVEERTREMTVSKAVDAQIGKEQLARNFAQAVGARGATVIDPEEATARAIHERSAEFITSEGFRVGVVQRGGGLYLGFSETVAGVGLSIGRARDLAASLIRVAAAAELTGLAARETSMTGIAEPAPETAGASQ